MIRRMKGTDADQVAQILLESFPPSHHQYMTLCQHGAPAYLRTVIQHPLFFTRIKLYVAVDDDSNQVNGFADFRIESDQITFLSYICVSMSQRGKGIASKLFDAHLKEYRTPGFKVQLDVFDDNRAARRLYENLGFSRISHKSWVERAVTAEIAGRSHYSVMDGHATLASHATYRFANLTLQTGLRLVRLGLTGSTVLRCYDISTWRDEAVLRGARSLFPTADKAVLVCDENGLRAEEVESIVMTSHRMEAPAAAIRTSERH